MNGGSEAVRAAGRGQAGRDQSPPDGPLTGVTILDLTRVLAGPYCTMVLADLGARVIKVERPGSGDDARQFGPFVDGRSAYFQSLNRGKQSIALDLKDAGDRAVLERLLDRADVLVENFRPGTLDALGFGWNDLHPRHPRLIYAAVSGFGRTGPYARRPAYDLVVQAMGGAMSLTGHPDGPPTRVGTSIGDITAGLFAAIGITSALVHRAATGRGMLVDVAMLDGQVAILENAIARYAATGQVPGPIGARHPSITPFDAFACADGHIVIAAGNDALFRALAGTIGRDDLPDNPLFRTNEDRTRHHLALKAELEAVLVTRPAAHWLGLLEAAGVPAGPINRIDQVLADPQVRARTMVVRAAPADGVGTITAGDGMLMAGNPVKLSAFPDPAVRAAAPDLDADRERILEELARPPKAGR
ncbi:MAG: CoA transferase [Rhodospirillales bacterium]|nr:MAG: CoA transferase [Rhodospirillales bacterium]